jgi:SAM-dependent methyltransferase
MPTEARTHPEHPHQHRQHEHHEHRHQQDDRDQQALRRVLDFDAEVFGDNLGAVLDRTGVLAARRVVDLGAGTGAGSRLLRQRFPEASVLCVDNDPAMLDRLRAQGFAVVEADLDQGYPAAAGSAGTGSSASAEAAVDLIWAASSLHHVAQPDRLLAGARQALAPDGVLAVVELAGLPRFLARPAEAALEQRCHTAAAAEGWNNYPDWTPVIENAGFVVTSSTVRTAVAVTPAAREYTGLWLSRFSGLASLTPADRDALELLLSRSIDDLELAPSVSRTVWVCSPTR